MKKSSFKAQHMNSTVYTHTVLANPPEDTGGNEHTLLW